jgi:SAM-dependent methyltransferase
MNCKELKNTWIKEEQCAFQGWDFSHLQSRWQQDPMVWDYKAIVKKYLRPKDRLLDMGTGGGEFLLSLNHSYRDTAVTEAWRPNIQLCMEKLAPLGIQVYPVQDDSSLPIADNSFDIVINRHEAYDLHEVRRVLKPGGMFITQQVGGENCATLKKRINAEPPLHWAFSLNTELPKFRGLGFSVIYADECFPKLKFYDIGAIVFWAKVIEWSFPGFSVERNFDKLCMLQGDIDQNGYVSDLEHRFIIAARNMK